MGRDTLLNWCYKIWQIPLGCGRDSMIYLDNAATTLHKPEPVIQAVVHAMQNTGNAARGAHGGALTAARIVYDARVKLAAFFGCSDPERVIFTSNSTEALNIALFGLINQGEHVISTDLEHNSVLRPLYQLEECRGVALSFLPADRQGCIDYAALEAALRPETTCIVCTHSSNLTGNMLDLAQIGSFAHAHGLRFVVDASQTAGVKALDMAGMHIDVLCFTGHKGLMGPQGTGGLCLAEGVELRPWKHGGSGIHSYDRHQPAAYPTRLEAGTLNCHGIAGLSAAVDYINEIGRSRIEEREAQLMWRFHRGVCAIPGVAVYGDYSSDRTAIVTLNIGAYDSAVIADELEQVYGIATRAGAHCAPRMHQALGTVEQGAVRFSFSWFNTEEEVDAAIAAVKALAEE